MLAAVVGVVGIGLGVGAVDERDERGERGETGISSCACTGIGGFGRNLGGVQGLKIFGIWQAHRCVRNRVIDEVVVAGTLALIIRI